MYCVLNTVLSTLNVLNEWIKWDNKCRTHRIMPDTW